MAQRPNVDIQGEYVDMSERLIVSPRWGRIRHSEMTEGQAVERGGVIGHVKEAGDEVPLLSHVAGFFAGWLVFDGDRVSPGKALARVRLERG
jgi:hypothetical protein